MSSKATRIPKVTVCVVTYNQEQSIEQCLQSIVEQETDFEFEVIVSDDCSTDRTPEIIQEFSRRYPNIKPILRERNIGALRNFVETHNLATGEYVCHMDGDDYWLPTKLQKQADFLDIHSECNLVWTRSLFKCNEQVATDLITNKDFFNRKFYRGDIIRYIAIGTNSSHMYRKKKLITHPNFDVVDYFKNVEVVGSGYASFVNDEPLTVYRVGIGISSNGTNIVYLMYCSMNFFWKNYPEQRDALFSSSLLLSYSCLKRKRFRLFFRFITLTIKCFSFRAVINFFHSLEVYKYLRVPNFSDATTDCHQ